MSSDKPSALGVITARGGSKGLPRKNVLPLGGAPLIAWTIRAAQASQRLTRTTLSTDDEEIAEVARAHGCDVPFLRPASLATDSARVEDAVLHMLDGLEAEYDYVVLLQATSPLRSAADIDQAVERCIETGAPACVTVTEPDKSPYWMFRLDDRERLEPLFDMPTGRQRQALPPTFTPTGAVYVARVAWFREHRSFYSRETVASFMPRERSFDIDTALDFRIVSAMFTASTN